MAKQGMARPDWTKRPRNSAPPVPEIQGKAKTTKTPARPIIAGTSGPQQKVYHGAPHSERPISPAHGIIDTDLARDTRGQEALISTDDSKVKVWVIPTNEELMIAQDTADLVKAAQ